MEEVIIDEMPDVLYKSCRSEHNPVETCGFNTIKLTPSRDYREKGGDPADKINDKNEGLSFGSDLQRNKFQSAKLSPDAYVFCASSKKMDPDTLDPDYKSIYRVTDVTGFTEALRIGLQNQLTMDNFPPVVQEFIGKYCERNNLPDFDAFKKSGLYVCAYNQPIIYEKTSSLIIENMTDTFGQMKLAIYCKEPKFAYQEECRLGFFVYHKPTNYFLDITANSVFVKIPDIERFVKSA